jgi:hypothetical protein
MDKAYKVLEDKERQLANLNQLQGNSDDIKAFVGDVMTHVDLSKEYAACLNEFRIKLRWGHLQ